MQRTTSQTNFRVRTLTSHADSTHSDLSDEAAESGVGNRRAKLAGKVALIHVEEPSYGALLALRYAREGADVALVYPEASSELEAVQRQIEAIGCRCVLYEVDLADAWNCGLVLQSTTECMGPVDFLVDAGGRVHLLEEGEELDADRLRDTVRGRTGERTLRSSTHSAA